MNVVWVWNCTGGARSQGQSGGDYVTALDKVEGEVRGRGAWLSLLHQGLWLTKVLSSDKPHFFRVGWGMGGVLYITLAPLEHRRTQSTSPSPDMHT